MGGSISFFRLFGTVYQLNFIGPLKLAEPYSIYRHFYTWLKITINYRQTYFLPYFFVISGM